MWECPKCKRSFKKVNQSHYCEKPQSVDDYISQQPLELQKYGNEMKEILRNALPDVQEKISWSMPTYWDQQNILHFALNKKHISLYPGEEAVIEFKEQLQDYKTNKGTIQFPYEKPLPSGLIETIAKWCYATVKEEEHVSNSNC